MIARFLLGLAFAVLLAPTPAFHSFVSPSSSSSSFLRSSLVKLRAVAPKLLQDPLNNAIGNFFEDQGVDESMSFIQCYMLALGEIDNVQYGVSIDSCLHFFPIHTSSLATVHLQVPPLCAT